MKCESLQSTTDLYDSVVEPHGGGQRAVVSKLQEGVLVLPLVHHLDQCSGTSGVRNGFYRLEKLFSELIPVTQSVVDSLTSSAPVAKVFMTSWEKAAVSRHSYKL